MYVAAYEASSQITWNALRHNVYSRLVCYLSYDENHLRMSAEFREGEEMDWS